MVSKNQIKLITSLQQKKYRTANKLFFAEGVKDQFKKVEDFDKPEAKAIVIEKIKESFNDKNLFSYKKIALQSFL